MAMEKSLVVGASVKYFSQSHKKWIECTVEQVKTTGEVQLSCKPGYWMSPAEQSAKLQIAGSGALASDGGGASSGRPPGDAGLAAAAEGSGSSASASSRRERQTTFSAEILPEQRERIRSTLASRESLHAAASAEFRRSDADRDGLLRPQDLCNCLLALNRELGVPVPHASQIDALVRKFDTDGDGALNASEFRDLFEQVLLRSRRSFVQWKVHSEFFVEKTEGDPWTVHESIKQLGEGSFGITHLVRDRRNQQTRVLKAVNKARSNMSPQELEQEIKGLKMLDHPHVIKLFAYYEDEEHIFLLMEQARGGELSAVIQEHHRTGSRVSERWAATVMMQVLKAIAYCHGRRLMHKDLKGENIMLLRSVKDGAFPHAVVIDLGMAEMFGSSSSSEAGPGASCTKSVSRPTEECLYQRIRSKHAGGTPYTMAPEVWVAYQGKGTFGMKCDVYSLGVVLFQLLTGSFPFMVPTVDASQWLARIGRGPPTSLLEHCSTQARGLVCKLLAAEPERPTAREALGHEWFTLKAQEAVMQLSDQMRRAICDFGGKNEFQKAILLQAASQMRAVDLPKVNAVFCTCDTDCSGHLPLERLAGALRSAGADEASAQRAAAAADLDKNGRIEYTEFVAACLPAYDDRLEAFLWQIFQKLLTDGSGTLTHVEIEQLLRDSELRGLGFAPSGTEIQQIVEELDRDRSGRIKFSEFRNYIIPRGGAPRQFTA